MASSVARSAAQKMTILVRVAEMLQRHDSNLAKDPSFFSKNNNEENADPSSYCGRLIGLMGQFVDNALTGECGIVVDKSQDNQSPTFNM